MKINVCFKKTVTIHSSDIVLLIVTVFLKQTLPSTKPLVPWFIRRPRRRQKKKGKKVAPAVGLDMRWTLFHKPAVKGHLEICQTIIWSLEISNFTDFHP